MLNTFLDLYNFRHFLLASESVANMKKHHAFTQKNTTPLKLWFPRARWKLKKHNLAYKTNVILTKTYIHTTLLIKHMQY